MRSRRSGSGRPSGDTKVSGRRVTCKAPLGPTWKEGQAAPRRRPQPSSRILTAWKGYSPKLPCENKRKANEEEAHAPGARGGDRLGRLHRPQPADGGKGKVRRLRREPTRA